MTLLARVVDTSAWIEWLTGSALGTKLEKLLPDQLQCIVPTIVQLALTCTASTSSPRPTPSSMPRHAIRARSCSPATRISRGCRT